MHSNNFSDYPEGSDASRLLHADAQTIDRVIHQIASDQQHDFFNADGTSVQVNPGTHFEIGMDGQVHMTDAAHHVSETVHAPIGAHTTPPYPPQTHVEVPHPVESIETPLEETPVTLPVEDVTSAQAEVPVPTSEEIETPITDTVPRGTVSADGKIFKSNLGSKSRRPYRIFMQMQAESNFLYTAVRLKNELDS